MLNNPGLAFDQNDQVISLIAVAEEHIADCHWVFGPIAMEDLELSPAQGRPVARLLRSSLREGGAIDDRRTGGGCQHLVQLTYSGVGDAN